MIFRQITHDDLGCASYLVGDEHAGVAAVIDPKFEIEEYLALARYMGVRIEHILETHNHADHVSGHGRLAVATGATIHVHRLNEPDYPHEAFDDGWELELGNVLIRALHTPGHRPEHTAFALIDRHRGPEPWAVLTGDTLFVGDVARPDLAIDKADGAADIYRSLHERLLALPDTTEVWPGHLGGSLCGGPGMDMKVSSTIGYERAHNAMLAEADPGAFAERVLRELPPQPPNFGAVVALNHGAFVVDAVPARPLTPRQVDAHQRGGALVVDVRTDLQFDDAHIPGAICNPAVRAGFGTKLAWVAEPGQDIVFAGRDDDDAQRAIRLAGAIGLRNVAGYLSGGMTSWREDKRPTASVRRVDAAHFGDVLAGDPSIQVLDVRGLSEYEAGHIAGSVHVPYYEIGGIPDGLDAAAPIAVICSSGQRSALAGSLLLRAGATAVLHVADGGVGTMAAAGFPLETTATAVSA